VHEFATDAEACLTPLDEGSVGFGTHSVAVAESKSSRRIEERLSRRRPVRIARR
jgi:hypothetical protein